MSVNRGLSLITPLKVVEEDAAPAVLLKLRTMILRVRPGTSEEKRQEILASWCRQKIKEAAAGLIPKWQGTLGVRVEGVFIQRMKMRWDGCNSDRRMIRLNTELAKKPEECLEYIVVHELAHLRVEWGTEPAFALRVGGEQHLPLPSPELLDLAIPIWDPSSPRDTGRGFPAGVRLTGSCSSGFG